MHSDSHTFARELMSAIERRSEELGADFVPGDFELVIERCLEVMTVDQRRAIAAQLMDPEEPDLFPLPQANGALADVCRGLLGEGSPNVTLGHAA